MNDGNVIYADFRKKPKLSLDISLEAKILYVDSNVALVQVTGQVEGTAGWIDHLLVPVNA